MSSFTQARALLDTMDYGTACDYSGWGVGCSAAEPAPRPATGWSCVRSLLGLEELEQWSLDLSPPRRRDARRSQSAFCKMLLLHGLVALASFHAEELCDLLTKRKILGRCASPAPTKCSLYVFVQSTESLLSFQE